MKNIRVDFDHISLPWQQWDAKYHTQRYVPQPLGVNGQQAALGGFELRALAKGWTEPEGTGKWRVRVTGSAVFVYDVYNFDPGGVEWLGYWNCANGTVSLSPWSGTLIENKDFRAYQDRFSLGRDYLVFSQPHIVENFKEVSYVYPL